MQGMKEGIMKYVQIGILVCLVVIAGLLIAIYQSQGGDPQQAEASEEAITEEAAAEEELMAEAGPAAPEAPVSRLTGGAPERPSPAPRAPEAPKAPARSPAPPPEPAEPPRPRNPEPQPAAPAPPSPPSQPAGRSGDAEAPAEPREPRRVTLPRDTQLAVRLDTSLSSETNRPGDTFWATLDEPIIRDGLVIAQKGARVEGEVFEVERAGRVKGVSKLGIRLVRLDTADGQTIPVSTSQVLQEGEKTKGKDAKKVGIGAGIGAIIGAIAGGGKGAAIGAGVGAGAGTGVVLATRGEPTRVPAESKLWFRLTEPVEVVENL